MRRCGLSAEVKHMEYDEYKIRCSCWKCGTVGSVVWDSDFNYDEVFGCGDGVVSYLHCANCGVEIMYVDKTDENGDSDTDDDSGAVPIPQPA